MKLFLNNGSVQSLGIFGGLRRALLLPLRSRLHLGLSDGFGIDFSISHGEGVICNVGDLLFVRLITLHRYADMTP